MARTGKMTGAWLAANGPYEYVDMQRVHTADPSHGDTTSTDLNSTGYTTPPGVAQTGFGLPDDEWMGGQGVLIEYSPQDHDLGIGTTAHPSDPYIGGTGIGGGELTQQTERAAHHAVSYGGELEYYPAPMQYHDERYGTIRSDGFGATLPNESPTGWRGTFGNSSPANNPAVEGWPDGFRRGSDLMVVGVDRKFHTGERYHDRHVVVPNDADRPTNQIRGDGHSPYLSPFDSAKRAITRAWNTPQRVVTPPDFSTDIISEPQPVDVGSAMPAWDFA